MKFIIRYFFRTVRLLLTPIVIAWDVLTTPKGIQRSIEGQASVDQQTGKFFLYHYRACPFCIKVKREMKRLSLNIDGCDANKNMECREDLMVGGGKLQVPCLKITDEQGNDTWMYESDEIIKFLQGRFTA
jgi:glutaredoxin